MQSNEQIVQIYELVKFCTRLCLEACTIVQECYGNKKYKTFQKINDGPVTQADFKIQTMLTIGLTQFCPGLRIVGEEDVQFNGHISTDYLSLPKIQFPQMIRFSKDYNLRDLCVWIDPIDNTSGFIHGKPKEVTVLIGISYKNKAEIGIIGIPFKQNESQISFEPTVILGCASEHFAYQYYPKAQKWQQLKKHSRHQDIIMTATFKRDNIKQRKIFEQLKAQKLVASGAGYKTILVLQGKADLFVYLDPKTKRWDTCCGDAILRAIGGYFVTGLGKDIQYEFGANSYTNNEGIICGFDQGLKQVCLKIINL